MFYRQDLPICLTYQADALFLAVKIPFQTKYLPSALKTQKPGKLSGMEPSLPDAVLILSGCTPSLLLDPEKHPTDK